MGDAWAAKGTSQFQKLAAPQLVELPKPKPADAQLGVVPPRGPHWKNGVSKVELSQPFVYTHASRDQSLVAKMELEGYHAAEDCMRTGVEVAVPSNHTAATLLVPTVVLVGQLAGMLVVDTKSPLV